MVGWRKLLGLVTLDVVFFLLWDWTAHRDEHSVTVSNVRRHDRR